MDVEAGSLVSQHAARIRAAYHLLLTGTEPFRILHLTQELQSLAGCHNRNVGCLTCNVDPTELNIKELPCRSASNVCAD